VSAFAGIVNLAGAPVDGALLEAMADSLAPRGPDGRGVWHGEGTALAHVLLRTTDEASLESQPFSFDGTTWIVADARVDARAQLVADLKAAGRDASTTRPDVELILHAWHAWGEECTRRLLGDFAFAIWDSGLRRLYCARDHFGIKPFFHAHKGDTVVFATSLAAVRLHSAVSSALDDLAVADFLIFGHPQQRDATAFADIRRLPPAHSATWSRAGVRFDRYWSLPIDEPLYLRRREDYTARLEALLREAVRDRTRTDRIGIMMSGGLDSTLLASFTTDILDERGRGELKAFTSLIGPVDEERGYAADVALALGIPVHYFDSNETARAMGGSRVAVTDEPSDDPAGVAVARVEYAEMAAHSRVHFFGEGPDNALVYEWKPYLAWLWSRRHLRRLVGDVAASALAQPRIPLLRPLIGKRNQRTGHEHPFPPWLDPGLVRRLKLRDRWEDRMRMPISPHPVRPAGHGSFGLSLWQEIFRGFDFDHTGAALEVRHPYLDLRVLRFMLQVPVLPWCRGKYLMREVGRGRLSETVRQRPKKTIAGDPFRFPGLPAIGLSDPAPEGLSRYVAIIGEDKTARESSGSYWVDIRPDALAAWLRQSVSGAGANDDV
jgi:asparagine synthase (glutamine-hydrolysing)